MIILNCQEKHLKNDSQHVVFLLTVDSALNFNVKLQLENSSLDTVTLTRSMGCTEGITIIIKGPLSPLVVAF